MGAGAGAGVALAFGRIAFAVVAEGAVVVATGVDALADGRTTDADVEAIGVLDASVGFGSSAIVFCGFCMTTYAPRPITASSPTKKTGRIQRCDPDEESPGTSIGSTPF